MAVVDFIVICLYLPAYAHRFRQRHPRYLTWCGHIYFADVVATDLRAYLIRTLCTDVANIVLSYISGTENTKTLSIKVIYSL